MTTGLRMPSSRSLRSYSLEKQNACWGIRRHSFWTAQPTRPPIGPRYSRQYARDQSSSQSTTSRNPQNRRDRPAASSEKYGKDAVWTTS
jgi:hypothetical protein